MNALCLGKTLLLKTLQKYEKFTYLMFQASSVISNGVGGHCVLGGQSVQDGVDAQSGLSHMEQLGDFFNSLEKKYHHLDLQLGIPGEHFL